MRTRPSLTALDARTMMAACKADGNYLGAIGVSDVRSHAHEPIANAGIAALDRSER